MSLDQDRRQPSWAQPNLLTNPQNCELNKSLLFKATKDLEWFVTQWKLIGIPFRAWEGSAVGEKQRRWEMDGGKPCHNELCSAINKKGRLKLTRELNTHSLSVSKLFHLPSSSICPTFLQYTWWAIYCSINLILHVSSWWGLSQS